MTHSLRSKSGKIVNIHCDKLPLLKLLKKKGFELDGFEWDSKPFPDILLKVLGINLTFQQTVSR